MTTPPMTTDQALTILQVDLETTGLDENTAEIIEVAAIGTTDALTPLFEFTAAVTPGRAESLTRLREADAMAMHRENGLLLDIESGDSSPLTEVESNLIETIDAHRHPDGPAKIVLAGSGVSHFDFRFIKTHIPNLAQLLHYRPIDAGSLRELYRRTVGHDLTDANERKTHRAIDDVRCHLEEAQAFAAVFTDHAARQQLRNTQ